MNDKANKKKMFLYLAVVCLLLAGGGIALTTGSAYQKEQEEITELYDQCMDDNYLSQVVSGADNRREFCQCRAKMMHDANMDLMTTQEIAVDMNLISASVVLNDITGYETSPEGLANIGSYFYCGMTTGKEE